MDLPFVLIGDNATPVFGLSPAERAARLARKAGLSPIAVIPAHGAFMVAGSGYAWDPTWLHYVAARPGLVLTLGGVPALAHLVADTPGTQAVLDAIKAGRPLAAMTGAVDVQAVEAIGEIENHALRKREKPYFLPLSRATRQQVEKASYDGAYKGVTDVLTLYLWRGLAFHLTRWAAAVKMTPNMVTSIGAVLCVIATLLFLKGEYWWGIAAGFGFMVLDTVDGKLARCTGTSSAWGNIFDHGLDLVHPPFWWWAWGVGLAAYGTPLPSGWMWNALWVIFIGYVVQRLIEGAFMRLYDMHIHVWEKFDSRFRLITARRNPNMILLIGALLFGRPDIGLLLVALWTALSCLVHLVRLLQAMLVSGRRPIRSWLK